MSGFNVIGIAQTGTGKTLAFLLPALIHIEMQITFVVFICVFYIRVYNRVLHF